ncbi:MAG: hypothetical protein ACPG5U_05555 [Planktomarina sp.]
MTADIIVHIGAPKCGSTYLQRVLLKNQKDLQDMGISYPHIGDGHPGNGLALPNLTKAWVAEQLRNHRTLLFSHEDLFSDPNAGRKLRNIVNAMGLSIQIIAFLRPFAEWLAADFSQTLKQSLSGTYFKKVPDFRSFQRQREAKIKPSSFLNDWQKLFPERPLRAFQKTDIRTEMVRLLPALDTVDWQIATWRTNPSLDLHVAEKIQEKLYSGDLLTAQHLLTNTQNQTSITSPPNIQSAHFQAEREWVAERFGIQI